MRRNLWVSLIFICVLSFGGLAVIFATNNHPALGLDLKGGIAVTLEPKPGTSYDSSGLDLAVDQIRSRVDSLGVAEPEIVRQGDAIVVNLPGVKDQDTALRLVQVTGKVYLRPVLQCSGPVSPTSTTTTVPGATTVAGETTVPGATTVAGATTVPGASTIATAAPTTAAGISGATAPAVDTAAPATTAAAGPSRAPLGVASTTTTPGATTAVPTTTVPGASATTTATTVAGATSVPGETTVPGATTVPGETTVPGATTTTTIPISDPTQSQILPALDGGQCYVGASPPGATGEVFQHDAQATIIPGAGWA